MLEPDPCARFDTPQPIRTGTLWYLNVHDQSLAPNFEWVQADARLFNEGLHLAWRTRNGSYASAMLDMEFCEGESSGICVRRGCGTDGLTQKWRRPRVP